MEQLIKDLIKKKEGQQLELIDALSKDDIANTICSFLNGKGGQILVGVTPKGIVTGVTNPAKYKTELQKYLYSTLVPEAPISISIEGSGSKKFMNIEVWEGAKKPYISNGSIFYRKGIKTVKASSKEVSSLIHSRQQSDTHWERQVLMGVQLKDLDITEIKTTIKNLSAAASSKKFAGAMDFLTYYGLCQSGYFTNAAVILFAKEPTRFLPQVRFRISVLRDEKTGQKFINDKILEGNLFKNFQEIEKYLELNLEHHRLFRNDKWQRTDKYIYPTEAIREGVINSLVHRDYESISGSASLIIYDDRLEITNTGKLPNNMTVADLKTSHISAPPNPDIAQISFLKGYIEKIGRGTLKILEEFKKAKLKEPIWNTGGGTVKLTFYNNLPKKQSNGINEGISGGIIGGISKADLAKIEEMVEGINGGMNGGITGGIKSKIRAVVQTIFKYAGINTNDIAEQIGIPVKTLEKHIKLLKDAGIIEHKGARRTGGYHIVKRNA